MLAAVRAVQQNWQGFCTLQRGAALAAVYDPGFV
jgi:hypothetical protein